MKIFKIKQKIDKSEVDTQDGGQYKEYICSTSDDTGVYIRIGSWDETKKHIDFNSLIEGKKISITIKVK